ncbi:MAG: response regulator [Cyanobacteria bacterium J06621_8]
MDYRKSVIKNDFKDAVPLILAVEDDEDNQLLLKSAIAMFGWNSIVVGDGSNITYLVKNEQPDLILLDVILPRFSGLQIARVLKSNYQTRHIPLIAVTAMSREKEQQLIFAAGFDKYIRKPYWLENLYQEIVSSLNLIAVCGLPIP